MAGLPVADSAGQWGAGWWGHQSSCSHPATPASQEHSAVVVQKICTSIFVAKSPKPWQVIAETWAASLLNSFASSAMARQNSEIWAMGRIDVRD